MAAFLAGLSIIAAGFAVPLVQAQPARAVTTCTDAACQGIPADRRGAAQLLMSFTKGTSGVPKLTAMFSGIIPTIEGIASGATPLRGHCDVDVRSLQLVAIVAKKYGSVQLTDLNRTCAGDASATCDGKTIDVSPVHCEERMLPPQGIDFGAIGGLGSPSATYSNRLLTFLSGVVPDGSRAETNCENGSYANFSRFSATGCNHQHVDFSNAGATGLSIVPSGIAAPASFPALQPGWNVVFRRAEGTMSGQTSALALSNWPLATAPNTSPSLSYLPNGKWVTAFIGSGGTLYLFDSDGTVRNTGIYTAPNSSPDIAGLADGTFIVSFVGSDNIIYTIDSALHVQKLGHTIAPGTSPSITATANSNWFVVFQRSNCTISGQNNALQLFNYGVCLAPGSSPSVAALANGNVVMSFVGSDNVLYVMDGSLNLSKLGHAIAKKTSPSITALANSQWVVAFNRADCTLSVQNNTLKLFNYGICTAAGSSPSVIGTAGDAFHVAFVGSNGILYLMNSDLNLMKLGHPMSANTSPSIG